MIRALAHRLVAAGAVWGQALIAEGQPRLLVPLFLDRILLCLLALVAVGEDDSMRHGQVGADEGSVHAIAATRTLQRTIVVRDCAEGLVDLLRRELRKLGSLGRNGPSIRLDTLEGCGHRIPIHESDRFNLKASLTTAKTSSVGRAVMGAFVLVTILPEVGDQLP